MREFLRQSQYQDTGTMIQADRFANMIMRRVHITDNPREFLLRTRGSLGPFGTDQVFLHGRTFKSFIEYYVWAVCGLTALLDPHADARRHAGLISLVLEVEGDLPPPRIPSHPFILAQAEHVQDTVDPTVGFAPIDLFRRVGRECPDEDRDMFTMHEQLIFTYFAALAMQNPLVALAAMAIPDDAIIRWRTPQTRQFGVQHFNEKAWTQALRAVARVIHDMRPRRLIAAMSLVPAPQIHTRNDFPADARVAQRAIRMLLFGPIHGTSSGRTPLSVHIYRPRTSMRVMFGDVRDPQAAALAMPSNPAYWGNRWATSPSRRDAAKNNKGKTQSANTAPKITTLVHVANSATQPSMATASGTQATTSTAASTVATGKCDSIIRLTCTYKAFLSRHRQARPRPRPRTFGNRAKRPRLRS